MEGKEYFQDPTILLSVLVVCSVCVGAEQRLVLNGSYRRWMVVDGAFERGRILRKKCSACKTSFSLIPGFLVPWHQYPRLIILKWLWACLWGSSLRNRRFLLMYAVESQAPPEDAAWTDWLDCDSGRTRPSYSLLWSWTQRFSSLAQQRIASLAYTLSALGLDVQRDFAVHLERMSRIPLRARWLALGVGLWRALLEASRTDGQKVELAEAVSSFVDYLLLSPSHGFTRAFSSPPDYTEGRPAGRSPPSPAGNEEDLNAIQYF